MKTWILPAAMTALAVVLLLGVLRPDTAREVAAIPKAWMEARTTTALKTRTRAEWDDITRRSADGDADAMYRLGMKMLFWSNEEWTGVATDPVRGEKLIRQAAEAGHLDARLSVWQMDGRDASELIGMAGSAHAGKKNAAGLNRLSDWLRWTALQECDVALRHEAMHLHQRFAAGEKVGTAMTAGVDQASETGHRVQTSAPDTRSPYRSFLDTFERRCPSD